MTAPDFVASDGVKNSNRPTLGGEAPAEPHGGKDLLWQ